MNTAQLLALLIGSALREDNEPSRAVREQLAKGNRFFVCFSTNEPDTEWWGPAEDWQFCKTFDEALHKFHHKTHTKDGHMIVNMWIEPIGWGDMLPC